MKTVSPTARRPGWSKYADGLSLLNRFHRQGLSLEHKDPLCTRSGFSLIYFKNEQVTRAASMARKPQINKIIDFERS